MTTVPIVRLAWVAWNARTPMAHNPKDSNGIHAVNPGGDEFDFAHLTAHTDRVLFSALVVVFTLAQACGYSEAAMRVQRDRYNALQAQFRRTQVQCDQRAARVHDMEAQNTTLTDDV